MDFKVNWDDKVWWHTVFIAALLAAVIVLSFMFLSGVTRWIISGAVGVLLLATSFMAPVKLRITSTGIVMFKLIGKKRFPYSDIKDIALCDLQSAPNIRIIGSGGFLGYTGLFYNKLTGTFTGYIGSMYRTVIITMNNDRRYIVSCLNPDKLVEISKSNIRAWKNRLQK